VPRACLKGGAGDHGRGWGRESPVVSPEISAGRSAGKTILPGGSGWSVSVGMSGRRAGTGGWRLTCGPELVSGGERATRGLWEGARAGPSAGRCGAWAEHGRLRAGAWERAREEAVAEGRGRIELAGPRERRSRWALRVEAGPRGRGEKGWAAQGFSWASFVWVGLLSWAGGFGFTWSLGLGLFYFFFFFFYF